MVQYTTRTVYSSRLLGSYAKDTKNGDSKITGNEDTAMRPNWFRFTFSRSLLHTAIAVCGTPSSENEPTSHSITQNFLFGHAVEVSGGGKLALPKNPLTVVRNGVVVGAFDCTVATQSVAEISPPSVRERRP